MKSLRHNLLLLLLIASTLASAQTTSMKLGLLKYRGGGDWYANPTSVRNLAQYCNTNLGMNLNTEEADVEPSSPDIFNYAFIHTTGHGNIIMDNEEAQNMRQWLISGGFWHIDDNYGMDKYVRPVITQLFPELELVEIPFTHPIYHSYYDFNNGLPKIHEHDNKPPKGYGIIYQGRIVIFYTVECDLGDGWEDQDVHKDPDEKRQQALKMGANIISYAFSH